MHDIAGRGLRFARRIIGAENLSAAVKRRFEPSISCQTYNSPKAAEFLSERANIPAVMLPYTVGGSDKAKDLFGLFDDTIERLLAVVK